MESRNWNSMRHDLKTDPSTCRGSRQVFFRVLIQQEFRRIIESDLPSPLTFLTATFLLPRIHEPLSSLASLLEDPPFLSTNRNGCRAATIFPFENILRARWKHFSLNFDGTFWRRLGRRFSGHGILFPSVFVDNFPLGSTQNSRGGILENFFKDYFKDCYWCGWEL